jgi:hypothetical protein
MKNSYKITVEKNLLEEIGGGLGSDVKLILDGILKRVL